jgi:DNA-binding transcriptional LysR family regulator
VEGRDVFDIRHLKYFVALGEELHFTKAAKRLNIAQPALSAQLRQLEERLGMRLVDRTNRRVSLTDAGLVLYARAKAVLDELEDISQEMADFAGAVRGNVTVGSLPQLGELYFPIVLKDCERLFPNVEVSLLEERNEDIIGALHEGRVDIALIDSRPLESVSIANLSITALFTVPTVVMMAEDHLLADRPDISLEDLRNERFVWFSQGSRVRLNFFLENCRSKGFEPTIAVKCSQSTLLRSFVSKGFGVSLAPQWSAVMEGPPIVAKELKGYARRYHIGLAWNKQHYSRAVAALADHIKRHVFDSRVFRQMG